MRVLIDGTVQGVGYRAFVKYYAQKLGLAGLVRNLPDGHVEIFCEGERKKINEFLRNIDLKSDGTDPSNPNVLQIDSFPEGSSGYSPAWKEYMGFVIDYGQEELSLYERESLENSELAKLQFWYLRNEVKLLRQDTNQLRMDTNNNFGLMAKKYGSISKELLSTKKEIKNAIVKLPDEMTKAFIKGLKKYNDDK